MDLLQRTKLRAIQDKLDDIDDKLREMTERCECNEAGKSPDEGGEDEGFEEEFDVESETKKLFTRVLSAREKARKRIHGAVSSAVSDLVKELKDTPFVVKDVEVNLEAIDATTNAYDYPNFLHNADVKIKLKSENQWRTD